MNVFILLATLIVSGASAEDVQTDKALGRAFADARQELKRQSPPPAESDGPSAVVANGSLMYLLRGGRVFERGASGREEALPGIERARRIATYRGTLVILMRLRGATLTTEPSDKLCLWSTRDRECAEIDSGFEIDDFAVSGPHLVELSLGRMKSFNGGPGTSDIVFRRSGNNRLLPYVAGRSLLAPSDTHEQRVTDSVISNTYLSPERHECRVYFDAARVVPGPFSSMNVVRSSAGGSEIEMTRMFDGSKLVYSGTGYQFCIFSDGR